MLNRNNQIKVLIVDDSLLFRVKLEKSLAEDPVISVVGTAGGAVEAMQKIEQMHPDFLVLDVEMPRTSGIDFLKKLLPQYPIPVLVISSRPEYALDAMEAGALDFEPKPAAGEINQFVEELKSKIKALHNSKVYGARRPYPAQAKAAPPPRSAGAFGVPSKMLVAIGASTGGTEAIIQVVKDLPPTTPGIVIVQHMPAGFTKLYSERLDRVCKMSAKEAVDGDRVETGSILVGAGDFHLSVKRDARGYFVRSQKGEKVSGHCPSVDVLFSSCAEEAGADCIGVILTGMGADGANGITRMRQRGAYTIGQDQESCVVYGMPMEAFKRGGISKQLPLTQIGQEILAQLAKTR